MKKLTKKQERELTGKTWIEVYDCDRCGSEFV